jgi:3-isopropylmalate/(R)-2-methylmalate dehydratase large subunit
MNERMTLTNMSAELGAQTGLIAPADETRTWLWQAGARDIELDGWRSDEDAPGGRHNFDASTLAPQIALPHSPAHARDVADIEPTAIQIARIGACRRRLDDLRAAARCGGYRVDPRAYARSTGQRARARWPNRGILRRLRAGAEILPASVGCLAKPDGVVPEASTVIARSPMKEDASDPTARVSGVTLRNRRLRYARRVPTRAGAGMPTRRRALMDNRWADLGCCGARRGKATVRAHRACR